MVTDIAKKNILIDISKLSCNNVTACVNATSQRLISVLDNETFNFFFDHLNVGRSYVLSFSGLTFLGYINDPVTHKPKFKRYKFKATFTDILKGDVVVEFWERQVLITKEIYEYLKSETTQRHYQFLREPLFDQSNWTEGRLVYNPQKPSYGINYQVGNVGTGQTQTGSGGTIYNTGGGQVITNPPINIPGQTTNVPVQTSGFDLTSIFDFLKNPVVLIGGIVVGYLVFKGSK